MNYYKNHDLISKPSLRSALCGKSDYPIINRLYYNKFIIYRG